MLDSKEITRLALLRAEEIKEKRKNRFKRLILCSCVLVVAMVMAVPIFPKTESEYTSINDGQVPLSVYQPNDSAGCLCDCGC